MFAHRLVRIRYAALFILLPSATQASPSDVLKPLSACISEAAESEKVLFPLGPNGQPLESSTVELMCEGPAAIALFQAMELIATQDMSNPPYVWRRSKGIQCSRSSESPPSYTCTVQIEVEPPFSKALQ
jgi:hypothetical protein